MEQLPSFLPASPARLTLYKDLYASFCSFPLKEKRLEFRGKLKPPSSSIGKFPGIRQMFGCRQRDMNAKKTEPPPGLSGGSCLEEWAEAWEYSEELLRRIAQGWVESWPRVRFGKHFGRVVGPHPEESARSGNTFSSLLCGSVFLAEFLTENYYLTLCTSLVCLGGISVKRGLPPMCLNECIVFDWVFCKQSFLFQ